VVLGGREFVVERGGRGDPQQRGGNAHVVRAVAHGDVEAAPSRPACERSAAPHEPGRLRGQPLAAMPADRRVLDAEPLAQLERLGEVARRDLHLVPVRPHDLDQRAHDQHVRTVRQVDPDTHSTTSRT
jgi:hypothetical protein